MELYFILLEMEKKKKAVLRGYLQAAVASLLALLQLYETLTYFSPVSHFYTP